MAKIGISTLMNLLAEVNNLASEVDDRDFEPSKYYYWMFPLRFQFGFYNGNEEFCVIDEDLEERITSPDLADLTSLLREVKSDLKKIQKAAPLRIAGYEVKLTTDVIQVGCRNVSYEELDNLVAYVKEHRKTKK